MTVVAFPVSAQRHVPPAAASRILSDVDLPALLKLLGRAFADYHAASGQPAILLGRSATVPGTLEVGATDAEAFAAIMQLNGFLACGEPDLWRHRAHPGYHLARIGGGRRAGD